MAYTLCMPDKQGYMHVRACTSPRARVPTRTHCFSTATVIRESASVLHYAYIAYLVFLFCFSRLFPSYYSTWCWSRGRTVLVKQPRNINHIPSPQCATPPHPNTHRRSLQTAYYTFPPFSSVAFFLDTWPLKMGPICGPETSFINQHSCVTSQKTE